MHRCKCTYNCLITFKPKTTRYMVHQTKLCQPFYKTWGGFYLARTTKCEDLPVFIALYDMQANYSWTELDNFLSNLAGAIKILSFSMFMMPMSSYLYQSKQITSACIQDYIHKTKCLQIQAALS